MNETLFMSLVEKKIIQEGKTEVTARFRVSSIGHKMIQEDDFLISKIDFQNGVVLNLRRITDASPLTTSLNGIIKVDGMPLEKLAESYVIDEDGNQEAYTVEDQTDVKSKILGKKSFTLPDGQELHDEMKIIFENDRSPDYCNTQFVVTGVGEFIKLKRPRGRPKKHFR